MFDAVGIACVEDVPRGVEHVPAPGKHCTFVGLARQGKTLWAASEDINCPIARHVLGCDLKGESSEAAAAALAESKLAKNIDAAARLLSGFRTLEPRRRVFVYFPIGSEAAAPPGVLTDVVVRFLRPEEAMRRIRAVVTATGERTEVCTAGLAAMCGDCTASPLAIGRAAFSPGCPGSRREVPIDPDEVLLAVPAHLERAVGDL